MGKYYYCSGYDEVQMESKKEPESRWQRIQTVLTPSNFVEWIFLFFFLFSVLSPLFLRLFDSGGVGWLFAKNGTFGNEPLGEIAVVLAPLLALALAIERVVETVFNYFEGTIENVVEKSTLALNEYKKLREKLNQAWKTVNEINTSSPTEGIDPLAVAEQQVTQFSEFLIDIPKDPKYLSYKKRMAILISFSLGYIVAIWTDHGMLAYLQIEVPRIFDILVTGAVLGAGVEPLHSLIGALDGLKGALKNVSFSSVKK